MARFLLVFFICLMVFLSLPAVGGPAKSGHEAAMWSSRATSLDPGFNTWPKRRHVILVSPDDKLVLSLDGLNLQVAKGHQELKIAKADAAVVPNEPVGGISYLAEAMWSPDSAAFYITQSDGGIVGSWYTIVYVIEGDSVIPFDVTTEVRKAYEKTYTCIGGIDPANVAGLAWVNGSSELLLVAEVPPHSVCRPMGRIAGYLVRVPSGAIVRALSTQELQTQWSEYFGPRVRNSFRTGMTGAAAPRSSAATRAQPEQ